MCGKFTGFGSNHKKDSKVKKIKPIIKFKYCPSCHSANGTVNRGLADIPGYYGLTMIRSNQTFELMTGQVNQGRIRVECNVCGFTTSFHKTISECAEEWNSSE